MRFAQFLQRLRPAGRRNRPAQRPRRAVPALGLEPLEERTVLSTIRREWGPC